MAPKLLYNVRLCVVPKPKERPRKGKYGNFYSPTAKHEQDLALMMRVGIGDRDIKDNCRVEIDIGDEWFEVRIWELREHKRIHKWDLDNAGKTVLDSLEKAGILKNDRYVRELEIKEVPE